MSVNESERGKGKFDVLIKANDLAVYTIRITNSISKVITKESRPEKGRLLLFPDF